jgi:M6 family metalloprotease-like protein
MKRSGYNFILGIVILSLLNTGLFAQVNNTTKYKAKSYGVPASPEVFTHCQLNGEEIQLYIKGDGSVHWYETIDGYTALRNKNNDFVYAIQDENTNLVPSNVLVSNDLKRSTNYQSEGISKKLLYNKTQVEEKRNGFHRDIIVKSENASKAFPTTGNRNVLLILIDFTDKAFAKANSDFDNLMNEANYNGTGSFKDFYLTSSYDQLTLTTTVTAWYHASNTLAYYGGNDENGYDERPRDLVREAVDLANANGVDFSIFDNDGDGEMDGVQVIHAGYGEEAGGETADCIWSHRWSLYDKAVTHDGVIIDDYAIYPELRSNSGTNITNIGVVCHEFGHSLGLPDYYDIDYDGSGGQSFDLGRWDMMAGGSWNSGGATPANHNCYSKWDLGWLEPIELKNDTSVIDMPNVLENDTAFIIYSQVNNEFFLLENRQQHNFDSYIPGHGLLIYHFDGNNWASIGNTEPDHQCLDIEEADNIQTEASYGGDPFPGTSNKTEFSDGTIPSMLAWDNSKTGVRIKDIEENGTKISFNLVKGLFVEIKSDYSGTIREYPFSVSITFSKAVINFELSDIDVSNGSAESFVQVYDSVYTVDIVPEKAGGITVKVGNDKAEDLDGNGNAAAEWSMNFDWPTGINKLNDAGIKIYPNPSNGIFNLEFKDEYSNCNIQIIDLAGRVLHEEVLNKINQHQLNLTEFKQGIYILRLNIDNNQFNERLIIK